MPRYINDLRPATRLQRSVGDKSESESETNEPSLWFTSAPSGSDLDISYLPGDAVFLDSRTTDESTNEDEAHVVPPPPEEAPSEGNHRLPALSVIMRSGGSVAKIVKTESGGLPFKRPRFGTVFSISPA